MGVLFGLTVGLFLADYLVDWVNVRIGLFRVVHQPCEYQVDEQVRVKV